jgi:t-SNARE complex subunit (syntaxin)
MDFASRLWTITKHILKIGRRSLSEAQAKQLAQIMLDPNVTADAIEAAVAQRAGNEAFRAAATSAGRAAAVGAAQQQGANQ